MNRLDIWMCAIAVCMVGILIAGCDDARSDKTASNPAESSGSSAGQQENQEPPALQPLIGEPLSKQPMTGPVSIMADYKRAGNRFGTKLYMAASQGEAATQNMFMSPLSVVAVLDMVSQGARGETLEQIWQTQQYQVLADQPQPLEIAKAYQKLHEALTPADDAPYQFTNANAVWALNGFELAPDIETISAEYFQGGLQELDLPPDQARQHINAWVMSKTNDLIQDLMPEGSIMLDTRLVLTNAVYFKGTWSQPFEKRATRDSTFTLADGTEIQTPMMRQSEDRFKVYEGGGYHAIELPYKGDAISMVVVLPDDPSEFSSMQSNLLGKDSLSGALTNLDAADPRPVDLMLPKFKMTWGTENLTGALQQMGMTLAFTPQADFSGFGKQPNAKLEISGIYHKAFIEVDEEGTEAAAATGLAIRATSVMIDPPFTFHVDHPFMFLIRHNETGTILFIGRVTDPR